MMQFSKVQFRLIKCETRPGQNVLVVGTFCEWDTNRAIEMTTDDQRYPLWVTEAVSLETGEIEYKYIVKDNSDGNI